MIKTKKDNKSGRKIVSLVLALVLLVGACVGGYFLFFNLNKEPVSVMEMSVNPNVQFVLNNQDKVIAVNYLNEDAEILLKEVNFEGKKAEDAAKLFVKLSTEAGYINVETTGTKVDVTITGNANVDFAKLKASVVNKVNAYFDENGIIAGAVASVRNDLKTAVQELGVQATYLTGKTEKEIMEILSKTSKDLEGVAVSVQQTILAQYNTIIAQLDSYMKQLDGYMEQINNSSLSQSVKDLAKTAYDALKATYDAAKEGLEQLIETAKTQSVAVYNAAKTTLKTAKEQAKTVIDSHVKATQNAIDAYRATINS